MPIYADDGQFYSAHQYHTAIQVRYTCDECHAATATWTIQGGALLDILTEDKTFHVNGSVDVVFQGGGTWNPARGTCTAACHDGATMYWR